MLLTERLSSSVSATTRSRGLDYFRSQRVRLESVNAVQALAIVRGTSKYEVDLTLAGDKILAICNCPYGDICKHIWATVLAAEPQGFARVAAQINPLKLEFDSEFDDDDDDDDRYVPANLRQSTPKVQYRPQPVPELWKHQLATLLRNIEPARPIFKTSKRIGERQLVFIVDLPSSQESQKLALEVNVQSQNKNGEWSVPKPRAIPTSEIGELMHPLDRQLLASLSGGERGDRYSNSYNSNSFDTNYRLTGPLLLALLPLLAQTDRVWLKREQRQPVLEKLKADLDPPWEWAVGVERSPTKGQWALRGTLHRGSETMPLSKPALLIPGVIIWNGCLGHFNDAGASAWVKTLRNIGTITVPESGIDEMVGQLIQMPRLPRLELPEELSYSQESIPPRPRLVVVPAKNSYGPPLLNAELSFDYDGIVVPVRPMTRGLFRADTKRFILRDAVAEAAAEALLTRLGVRPGYSYGGAPTLELKPALLPKIVRELIAAGWNIEADGKLYRQAGEFKLAVRSETDWFDLQGTADFGGMTVPFPRLLAALRKGEQSIVLDDGSLGMVPEDWLKKYGILAQMGMVEGDSIRFSRAQVGVLDALLASRPEVTFDKQYARARDQLHKFVGVAAVDPPKGFVGELREYQREGLGWLKFIRKFGFGGCLADDMGLGKTVQVLALLAGKRDGPALVVVPKSLIFNWKQEAAKFTPKLKVLDHTGTTRDRTGANFRDFDIVLTTYGTLRNDADAFTEIHFDSCILDESQAAKNATTETAKAVRLVQADHRIAMSGTPVENHLGELWTLFDFLNPGMLGRAMLTNNGSASIRNPDAETRELLAKALRPFILRRTKDQVAKDLPAKTEQTVYCDLEPAQRQLYDELREHYRQSLLARIDSVGLAKSKIHVLEALLRLRQAACHPGLIDKKRTAEPCAKLDILLPQLRELAESGCKALVFSQFTSLLSIVRNRLDAEGVAYEYLDGKTRDRAERVERFQTDPTCKLFLVSLKAGGVGLNLTAAEYVFLLDPWWNPAVEAQAIDRSHRIGQTKPVFAYRLIARGTVEEKVLALQKSKRDLADAILGGDGRLMSDLKREDLELLLS